MILRASLFNVSVRRKYANFIRSSVNVIWQKPLKNPDSTKRRPLPIISVVPTSKGTNKEQTKEYQDNANDNSYLSQNMGEISRSIKSSDVLNTDCLLYDNSQAEDKEQNTYERSARFLKSGRTLNKKIDGSEKGSVVLNTAEVPPNFEESFIPRDDARECTTNAETLTKPATSLQEEVKDMDKTQEDNFNTRVNAINMQMLSKSLHEQIFKNASAEEKISPKTVEEIKHNLKDYGIEVENASRLPDVDIKIPPLQGEDIEEHFFNIAKSQTAPYIKILNQICKDIPKMPKQWVLREGWTRYTESGAEPVDYPLEDGMVFDVEVCMKEGPLPTIATAVTQKAWYGWVSKALVDGVSTTFEGQLYTTDVLIPIESKSIEHGQKLNAFQKKPKMIVGYNVSYDRSRIKEQYWLNCTGTRFVDAMSLHTSISGLNSNQKSILSSKKENHEREDWFNNVSLNSLAEVHKLYCGSSISKDTRDIFVNGNLQDIKADFNELMNYCASDVQATHNVLTHIFPIFQERFPHPVTLAGMLELGIAYLPINNNWQRYIEEADSTFDDLNYELKCTLAKRADAVCELMHNEKYKEDLWMWDEDWSVQELALKKSRSKANKERVINQREVKAKMQSDTAKYLSDDEEEEEDPLQKEFAYLEETKEWLPAKRPHMPGYPAWYRKLCLKSTDKDWAPGVQNISTIMLIVPKLLNLTWENYPLYHIKTKGWGCLIPYTNDPDIETKLPIKQLLESCPPLKPKKSVVQKYFKKMKKYANKKVNTNLRHIYNGTAIWCDVDIDNCCYFFKLPHKNGANFNVGNPLSKDFLNKFSENVLASSNTSATDVLKIAKMVSYWRNNRQRIKSQFAVWLESQSLGSSIRKVKEYTRYGAILPMVIVTGTLTRRAVERTWMTASNAEVDRVGSELRAMVQAPAGYNIVGADVDSQELWIASVIGDAHYKKIHGATPFGWMTLDGNKTNGTDMHSITAKAVGISRSHAKVINYARIYGAGQKFAESLLQQFNPSMSQTEAANKAQKMFAMTKGRKVFKLRAKYLGGDLEDREYSAYEALKLSKLYGKMMFDMFEKSEWVGGSESAMFNRLEQIANEVSPVTPFLSSRLTRALEGIADNDKYLTTKVNWVVQSGAVDFLHLMLVSMRWLMKDNARFCLSFHDEVRYLVPTRYKYNAALAMHITNLLTRTFCASRLGMKDLPLSVAFFAAVEVDTVLRKEANDDCKTPSNPHGLENGYRIPPGETLNIWQAIEKSEGSVGSWHNTKSEKPS